MRLGVTKSRAGRAIRQVRRNVLLPLRWGEGVFVVVAQIRWIAWSISIPHNRTVRSQLPVARVCPSGLNTTAIGWTASSRSNTKTPRPDGTRGGQLDALPPLIELAPTRGSRHKAGGARCTRHRAGVGYRPGSR